MVYNVYMKIIAIVNAKGGVGKTTVAEMLAKYLPASLLDMEQQQEIIKPDVKYTVIDTPATAIDLKPIKEKADMIICPVLPSNKSVPYLVELIENLPTPPYLIINRCNHRRVIDRQFMESIPDHVPVLGTLPTSTSVETPFPSRVFKQDLDKIITNIKKELNK